jgi:hypothetical protein
MGIEAFPVAAKEEVEAMPPKFDGYFESVYVGEHTIDKMAAMQRGGDQQELPPDSDPDAFMEQLVCFVSEKAEDRTAEGQEKPLSFLREIQEAFFSYSPNNVNRCSLKSLLTSSCNPSERFLDAKRRFRPNPGPVHPSLTGRRMVWGASGVFIHAISACNPKRIEVYLPMSDFSEGGNQWTGRRQRHIRIRKKLKPSWASILP